MMLQGAALVYVQQDMQGIHCPCLFKVRCVRAIHNDMYTSRYMKYTLTYTRVYELCAINYNNCTSRYT